MLDGNCRVGFEKFKQFVVRPFQAVLLREKTKDGYNPDDLSAALENYASGQVLLKGQEGGFRLSFLKLAHPLLDRTPEHTGAAQKRLQGVCFDTQRPGQRKVLPGRMKIENGNFFGANQIGDDFSDGVKDVTRFDTLNKPRARGVEAHKEKMIPFHLFAEGELVYAQAELFRSGVDR